MQTVKADVAIIGAGTAGLSALKEIEKVTDRYVLIDGGPGGTTCARVGCMPSKVLIQIANDFHRRHVFSSQGISGHEHLTVDIPRVLQWVRQLRDQWVEGILRRVRELGERKISGYARFLEPNVLEVEGKKVIAKKIVIATGSSPIIPKAWKNFGDCLLTTDTLFEQKDLPLRFAVIGLGAIGLEMAQALARLGLEVFGLDQSDSVGGITDPKINACAVKIFGQEMKVCLGQKIELVQEKGQVVIQRGDDKIFVDKILLSIGRKPNLQDLGMENLGVSPSKDGTYPVDPLTTQLGDLPVFLAGDVNGVRPVLHEASDEGKIAGFNACREKPVSFQRKIPMGITFTDPNICSVGEPHGEILKDCMAVGEASFENQGRAVLQSKARGMLRVYGDKTSGKLMGAEMVAPSGEHLTHLLAWCLEQGLNVQTILKFPFYHPVIEEGLRTALRDLLKNSQIAGDSEKQLATEGLPQSCFN
jgi:dihydrolipoamide dehydrogenase